MEVGKESEGIDKNLSGQIIKTVFRGLSNLHVIHEELEHGSEILYEEKINLEEEQLTSLIRPKQALNVFRPRSNPISQPED